MKSITVYLSSLMFMGMAAASSDETRQFLNKQSELNQHIKTDPSAFRFKPPQPGPLNRGEQDFIDQLQARQRQQFQSNEEKPIPRAIYFLSFSLPQDGLKQRVNDAVRLNIPATLRGFVNNSLKDTATVMYDLVKEDKRGGIQIDPTVFRKYAITAVPALVVLCGDSSDRIAGNLNLNDMLNKVAEEGECAEVAKVLLREAGEAQ